MQQMQRKAVGDGVSLTIVSTNKFKTSAMSMGLCLPLGDPRAAQYAALPMVLGRGTAQYPDMRAIGAALDELYGARVQPSLRKVGESVVIGFVSDVACETYTPDGKGLTARAAALLTSFWQQPYWKDGKFSPDYTAGERENLVDRIEALKNDPRSYAQRRLYEVMCEGERFGQSEYGTVEGARAITPESLFDAYRYASENACIELFYCGAMEPEAVETAFRQALGTRAARSFAMPRTQAGPGPRAEVRTVIEEMGVRQGKLSLGFRTGVTGADPEYPALVLLNSAFGGSTSSKLFLNVRERLSLCYYASAALNKHKGVMQVASGIENENFEVARDEILRQLRGIQQGSLSDDEVEAARRTVQSSLRAMQDSPFSLENFWLGQSVAGLDWGLDELSDRIGRVTRDEVIAAAGRVQLDTVYFLKGVAR